MTHSGVFQKRTAGERWIVCGICIFLAAIVCVVFGQTSHYGFINFDDDIRVYENPHITSGLTLKGIEWAFTQSSSSDTYWDPLSAISHMLDWQLHGNDAGGHHLTNVLLHAATAILLFLALRRMTGALWRSAFAAAVFTIHPLRVESVAWVTERRDVLSGLFFMLTLLAYAGYARHKRSTASYLMALCFFALGLMSKPMLVTLPFVLLLLDYWPLNRFAKHGPANTNNKANVSALIVEKIPFFALSAIFCAITIVAQRSLMIPVEKAPIPLRLGNALISCVIYLRQMFWPAGLALLYPFPEHAPSFWKIASAFVLLAAISAAVIAWRRTRPWLLTGWFWYLGMLLPVSGILQSGEQAHADRFTYLPQIGLYLLVTWTVADLAPAWRFRRVLFGCIMTTVIATLTVCAFIQTSYWQNSTTIWTHTLACTPRNPIAHNNLGNVLQQQKHMDEAIAHYRQALEVDPDYAAAHNNLGDALQYKGALDEAIAHFRRALEIKPGYAMADFNLGNTLTRKGRGNDAISFYRKAIELKPDYVKAHVNLGNALQQQGRMREALAHYQKAVDLKPDLAAALNNLALVLATSSDASLRNGSKAVGLAQRANRFADRRNPTYLGTLAASYAESGHFPEAVETAKDAIRLAVSQGNTTLASLLQTHLKLYQAGKPLRAGP